MHDFKHSAGEIIAKDWQKLAHKARDAVSPSRGGDHSRGSTSAASHARHSTTDLVFEEGTDEEDEGWASERSNGGDGQEHDQGEGTSADGHAHAEGSTHSHGRKKPRIFSIRTARRKGSIHRRNSTGQAQTMPFMVAAGATAGENEESRGRQAPPGVAGSGETRGRQQPALAQKTGHGHGKSRLGTAASRMSRPSTAPSSATPTRPGTAESSLRNQRIDSIRALHSRPPTREASPSRSVRFVDEGVPVSASRSGSVGTLSALFGVGSRGNGTGTGVVDQRVEQDVEMGLSRAGTPVETGG